MGWAYADYKFILPALKDTRVGFLVEMARRGWPFVRPAGCAFTYFAHRVRMHASANHESHLHEDNSHYEE